tara:strand:+ start:175 stop:309 length:135 start_codon:yes stop_codon:yes gene_type:complete
LTINAKVGGYFLQEYRTLEKLKLKKNTIKRKQKEKDRKRIGDKQ